MEKSDTRAPDFLSVPYVSRGKPEVFYSVEHFYPTHPDHPLATLTAEHHGYFQQEGIRKVTLGIAGDDTGSIDYLVQGTTHFSIDAHPLMVMQANAAGKEIYIIGSYRNGLPFTIFGRKGLHSVHDLKGKRLGIIRIMGVAHRIFLLVLPKFGMDPERDVELVDAGETFEKMENIRKGFIDATIYHHDAEGPLVERHIESGEFVKIADLSQMFPHYVTRSMAASGRMMRERPEVVKAFVKAVMRATQYLHDEDPMGREAVELARRALRVDSMEGSRLNGGRPLAWPLTARDVMASAEGLAVHIEEARGRRQLPERFGVENVLRNEFAGEALRELGLG